MPEDKIISHAKVGIIGGGIMGVSLLYHLAKEGWKDLVLIEKGELTSGSTWHAAGQCPQMMGSYNLAKIHLESTNLYKRLEKETEQPTGFHDCGSLRLAYKKEDLDWFKYVKGILDNVGAPAEIISSNEINKVHPFIKLDGIVGAFHTPEDGHTDPTSTTNAMAKGARNHGAKIYRKNRVTDIKLLPSGEWKLITEKGDIICEHVVNAAGSYGSEVVLLDYNLERLKKVQSKINDLCIHCDVTNKGSVKRAFKQICEKFGGIDILVSNAGIAPGGSIGEVSDDVLRKSFEVNFFSHQNCASEAVKIMKKQNINGCLLFNISKQSVNPGKNFGPYGLPKSALLSLCKQYAVDYGSYGIRSNGVNADRIRSGLMNDKMIRTRAKARSISADDYMRGNLLLNEVKAEDVAKAFFHLATSKKTTGAVLTVDGGNIAASLR